MSDRAQSETIGFVLVFAIIVGTVALVSATGYSGLETMRDHEQTNNAERGIEVMADNVADLVRNDAPTRTTELRLAGEHLTTGDPTRITVSGERTDTGENFSVTYESRPIVYDPGTGTKVVYANGAVIREDHGGARMRVDPWITLRRERVIVPVVQPHTTGTRSVGGTTTVLVETRRSHERLAYADANEHNLTITVESPRVDAWHRYFAAKSGTTCETSATTVSCDIVTQRVYVRVVGIDVRFD